MSTRTIPELRAQTEFSVPDCEERELANGLTILAIQRHAVPLAEVRLRIPLPYTDAATSAVMAQTLLSGTADKSMNDIAIRLQTVGGSLNAAVDADRFLVAGNSLSDGLPELLSTVAEVIQAASYPDDQVLTERERLADRINVARQQPAYAVQRALLERIYGQHPYASQTPEPEDVNEVDGAMLRTMHAQRLQPQGATLVVVGDLPAGRLLDMGEAALTDWNGVADDLVMEPVPPIQAAPVRLADRPGSVQSSIRMAMTALPRTHPDNAAQQLANLIFGGYASSRMVANVREDKGYSYSPRSLIDHGQAGSVLIVAADVATEVTAPAFWEMQYELGRMVATSVTEKELEQARRYALGSLRLGTSTQSGLASLTSTFAGHGLRPGWLLEHAKRLANVTVDDVRRVSQQLLAPGGCSTVILGDAAQIKEPMELLANVESS